MSRIIYSSVFLLLLLTGIAACRRQPPEINGVWQGAVYLSEEEGDEVPFKIELQRTGDQVIGVLLNGDERVSSTSGSWDGKNLQLRFDFYDGELNAALVRREMIGEFTRQWQKQTLRRPLKFWRVARDFNPPDRSGKDVSGDWVLRVGEGEQQQIWRAALRQDENGVTGTMIPVSGDWGVMTGSFYDGKLLLARFDGINARTFRAVLKDDGTLAGAVDFGLPNNRFRKVIGQRKVAITSASQPAPPDPNAVTRMKNPAEPFRFSFADSEGRIVSATDERFKNKVVVLTIGGSWCPNCHDEAKVLNDLYERYHAQGLEIVGLSFEYTGEVKRDTAQMLVFARRHGVKYPMLLAGTTEEGDVERKLPQLTGFAAYPTAIFIGRDGRVKRIHAGFEGPATGERYARLKAEIETLVQTLLAEQEG